MENKIKARILTTSEASSKHFMGSAGQGYTVFSEALQTGGGIIAGPKNFMVKTAELDEFVELVIATRDAWRKAKAVEAETNTKEV